MPAGVKFEGALLCGHSNRKHRAKGLCAACYNTLQVRTNPQVRAATQKRMRKWHLKRKFGIDEAKYQALLKAQHGVCRLCLEGPNGRWKRLQVDHDHATGAIRGLLCWNCNYRIVGKIESKLGMLNRLQQYLRESK